MLKGFVYLMVYQYFKQCSSSEEYVIMFKLTARFILRPVTDFRGNTSQKESGRKPHSFSVLIERPGEAEIKKTHCLRL